MMILRTIGWMGCLLSTLSVLAQREPDTLKGPWLDRDFLDLSSERSRVYVNPFVDFSIGNTTGITYPATSFENNRGARFEAVIDSVWKLHGALQERQGTGDPLLSWWAFQFVDSTAGTIVLPSWGRTKWRNKEAFIPGQALEFDGARAIGMASRTWKSSTAVSSLAIGIDNLHEGQGEGSVFWSRSAAPLPFFSMQWQKNRMQAKAWVGNGIGAERGPAGSTAESIYARQRITRLGWGWSPQEALNLEIVWMHAVQFPFEGQERMNRNWGGPQVLWEGDRWSGYAALSWDWNRLFQNVSAAPPSLSQLIRMHWHSPRAHVAGEWQKTHMGSSGQWSPTNELQLPLVHSGNPILSNWGDGLSVFSIYSHGLPIRNFPRFQLETTVRHLNHNPLINPLRSESSSMSHPRNMMEMLAHFQPIANRPFFVRAGIMAISWVENDLSTDLRRTSVTYCIALTHNFSSLWPLPAPNPSLFSNSRRS